jgi:hypothetical protein
MSFPARSKCMALVWRKCGAPHFRQSCAMNMLASGDSLTDIKNRLDHENIQSTMLYLRLNLTRKREVQKKEKEKRGQVCRWLSVPFELKFLIMSRPLRIEYPQKPSTGRPRQGATRKGSSLPLASNRFCVIIFDYVQTITYRIPRRLVSCHESRQEKGEYFPGRQ